MRSGLSNTFWLNLGFVAASGLYAWFYPYLRQKKWLPLVIMAAAIVSLLFSGFVMLYGRYDTATFTEDIAIVLGAGLRADGTPSRSLQSRLDAAVLYHGRNPAAQIVVSGGVGHGQAFSEAQAMARFLESAGIPSHLIILEGASHSTYENMRLSMAILEELFPTGFTATVITNDFHMYRSIRFTRIVGMEGATSFHGSTPLTALPGALVRELSAIVKMWLLGT